MNAFPQEEELRPVLFAILLVSLCAENSIWLILCKCDLKWKKHPSHFASYQSPHILACLPDTVMLLFALQTQPRQYTEYSESHPQHLFPSLQVFIHREEHSLVSWLFHSCSTRWNVSRPTAITRRLSGVSSMVRLCLWACQLAVKSLNGSKIASEPL